MLLHQENQVLAQFFMHSKKQDNVWKKKQAGFKDCPCNNWIRDTKGQKQPINNCRRHYRHKNAGQHVPWEGGKNRHIIFTWKHIHQQNSGNEIGSARRASNPNMSPIWRTPYTEKNVAQQRKHNNIGRRLGVTVWIKTTYHIILHPQRQKPQCVTGGRFPNHPSCRCLQSTVLQNRRDNIFGK